jgi:hypothetical protein
VVVVAELVVLAGGVVAVVVRWSSWSCARPRCPAFSGGVEPGQAAGGDGESGPDRAGVGAVSGQPVTPPLMHQGEVTTVAWSPDGRRLVTASFDKTARVWDAVSGQAVTLPLAH